MAAGGETDYRLRRRNCFDYNGQIIRKPPFRRGAMTTPEQEISWTDATLMIMREANRPIHYGEVAEIILSRQLKTTIGKTPHFTVAGEISKLRSVGMNIIKTAPGVYQLLDEAESPHLPEPVLPPYATEEAVEDIEDELDATDATQHLSVAAYGLFWERDKVDWGRHRIWGYDISPDPSHLIDFADQQGVYLLHNWQSVVYVGKTSAKESGLFQRLSFHHQRQAWSRKWERFSWFGIRRVDEVSGEMLDVTDNASPEVVTALMEAVLIEALGPSFNNQRGTYMGTLYRQFAVANLT